MINLFLYIPENNGPGERLVQISQTLQLDGPVTLLCSLRQLTDHLRQPLSQHDVIILCLPSRRHLEELLPIVPLMERVRVIAILPDPNPGTISMGHKLRPRFLTTVDQGLENVAAVLKKMRGSARPASEQAPGQVLRINSLCI